MSHISLSCVFFHSEKQVGRAFTKHKNNSPVLEACSRIVLMPLGYLLMPLAAAAEAVC